VRFLGGLKQKKIPAANYKFQLLILPKFSVLSCLHFFVFFRNFVSKRLRESRYFFSADFSFSLFFSDFFFSNILGRFLFFRTLQNRPPFFTFSKNVVYFFAPFLAPFSSKKNDFSRYFHPHDHIAVWTAFLKYSQNQSFFAKY